MIGAVVAVRRPFGVDLAIHQAEGGAVVLAQGVELDHAVDVAVARAVDVDRCVIGVFIAACGRADNESRSGVGAIADVDGVKPLHVIDLAADRFFGIGNEIDDVVGRVDYRRTGDAYFRVDITRTRVPVWDGGDGSSARKIVIGVGGIQERALPEDGAVGGVEGGPIVVLRGDKNDRIVSAGRSNRVRAGLNGDVGQNQRFGIDMAVEGGVVELAEIGRVDVRRRQLRLGQVGPGRLGVNVVLRNIRREQAAVLEFFEVQNSSANRFTDRLTTDEPGEIEFHVSNLCESVYLRRPCPWPLAPMPTADFNLRRYDCKDFNVKKCCRASACRIWTKLRSKDRNPLNVYMGELSYERSHHSPRLAQR